MPRLFNGAFDCYFETEDGKGYRNGEGDGFGVAAMECRLGLGYGYGLSNGHGYEQGFGGNSDTELLGQKVSCQG